MTQLSPSAPQVRRKGFFRRNLSRIVVVAIVLAIAVPMLLSRLKPVGVVAMPVVRGSAIDAVYATGTVEADDRIQVKAKTSGSISEIVVKEGDRVKKGDLIARIDNPQLALELKRGKVDLNAASAQGGVAAPQLEALKSQAAAISADLAMARQDATRLEKLLESGAVATSEVDRAKARVAQLQATLSANEAQQKALRIDLSANAARQAAQVKTLESRVADTEVRAPIDGVILTKQVEIGEVITVNQTLFKVGDTSRLVLEVAIDEADVAKVNEPAGEKPGSKVAVSLYAFPREIFSGHVFEILPDANRERKSFLAKVQLDKPPSGLRSGMSGEVNIVVGQKDGVLLAPTEAEADGFVWLVNGNRVNKVPIKVGIRDLLRVEVESGLNDGALVLIEGQDKVQEGSRVSVTQKEPNRLQPVPEANTKTAPAVK
ncbi:MAG: efflux RND transporter periplasmic adaptor subunit [Polyangiaceae bacterium]|nr:efflux RND transporter periplasmic adaptor subunit [Polyangiaceae bacterium]